MTLATSSQKPSDVSLAAWIASRPLPERQALLRELAPTPADRAALEYSWAFWARPKQLEPIGNWLTWLILAGRGFGKTRTGAEWVRSRVDRGARRITIVGRTAADVRDVMIEGESGLLAISPPWNRPHYEPSKRRLTWPNGCRGTTYSADEPDQMRGPQGDTAWCDELAAWQYDDSWDQVQLGLRSEQSGLVPRAIVTTTPRPTKLVKDLVKDGDTSLTEGSTYENAGNMAASFFRRIRRKYEGTRLGEQELYARILDDTPGALWNRAMLEALHLRRAPKPLKRIVVAVDPAVSNSAAASRRKGEAEVADPEASAETGIIVVGLDERDHAIVLQDLSGRYSPNDWATRVVHAYKEWGADRVIAEVNNGGDLVEATIRTVDERVSYEAVHASRGKYTRAEPVAALYEQGRVHHVGVYPELEDQMTTWVPGVSKRSPDRVDALVWGVTELLLGEASPDLGDLDAITKGVPARRFAAGRGGDDDWDD